jgi:hypothetical protein
MVVMSGDLAQSKNYDLTNAAPESQAGSYRWRSGELMAAVHSKGVVDASQSEARLYVPVKKPDHSNECKRWVDSRPGRDKLNEACF